MNQTFEQRIQSIENELKEIRKELEESLERYKHGQYPFTNGDISKFRSGTATACNLAKAHGVPCFNLYNEDDKQRLIKFVES